MYRQVEESQTFLINTQSKNLTAQNKKVIKFGIWAVTIFTAKIRNDSFGKCGAS